VISAVVQDALISVKDFTYDRGARSFTVVANRFRWEAKIDAAIGDAPFERTLCALAFTDVDRVTYRGFRRNEDERILSLLSIRIATKPGEAKAETIDLDFSGGAVVRLGVSAVRVRATDIGEPWPTAWQPDHAAGEP
jgi:hypothetical protein